MGSKLWLSVWVCLIGVPTFALPKAPKLKTPTTLTHPAAFRESWRRYPSPPTLIQVIQGWFVVATPYQPLADSTCHLGSQDFDFETSRNLGANLPLSGRPISEEPNPSFMSWYSKCLIAFVRSEYYSLGIANPAGMIEILSPAGAAAHLAGRTWQEFSVVEKEALIQFLVEKMIGPEEIVMDLGVAPSLSALVSELREKTDRLDRETVHPLIPEFGTESRWPLVYTVGLLKYQIAMRDILRL